MSSDAVAKIAEESKKITDSVQSSPSMFGRFFETITSSISTGIFVSPPFSLENFFPSVDLFKNKYFKLVSIVVIYLGLIVYILSAFKPKNTRDMFLIYSVCFWIATMAFSIIVVNPYDENSVEYMLKDKVIKKVKEVLEEKPEKEEKSNGLEDSLLKGPGNAFLKMAPDGVTQMLVDAKGTPLMDSDGYVLTMSADGKTIVNDLGDIFSIGADGKIVKISSNNKDGLDLNKSMTSVKMPQGISVSDERKSLFNTIKGFF